LSGKPRGISWMLIYKSLRSERFPHDVRVADTGMNLQEIKALEEAEYVDLVTEVYHKALKEAEGRTR